MFFLKTPPVAASENTFDNNPFLSKSVHHVILDERFRLNLVQLKTTLMRGLNVILDLI